MATTLDTLAGGVRQTVAITASAFTIGALAGLPLAMLRRSTSRWVRGPVIGLVEVLRAVPPIVWLFIVYYSIGSGWLTLTTFQAAAIGLGLVSAAHLSEIYRAGLEAVPAGQWEAVRALALPAQPSCGP